MKKFKLSQAGLLLLFIIIGACSHKSDTSFSIDYEKYELDNGLEVILHHDTSDPVTAVSIMYHVGSSRETPGKTGFAHLFEHMLFQESENIPQDEFFRRIQNAGGTLNGFTSKDVTTYFEIVPKNALEMVLWMESDRMGYFINTVTQQAFGNQQNVVINEKRQHVDNRPYGHTRYVIDKNLYPEGHPYSWQVIGEMDDVENATVEDVKDFYNDFYGPNNATLVIAGDYDPENVKDLVEKYFGEIIPHGNVEEPAPMTVSLEESKRIYHEDNYARLPEINMVWPAVEEYHKDAYALRFLGKILSDGKQTPMYKVLVKEKKLTSNVRAYNQPNELAGKFVITIKANEGHSLGEVEDAVFEAFRRFEEEGITQTDIDRVKAGIETDFYNSLNSVFYKALQLSYYNTFTGNPGFIEEDIRNIQVVSLEDVQRVYEMYIKDRPHIVTSFVPRGDTSLIAENSVPANIVEEDIANATEIEVKDDEEVEIPKTPSKIDRSVEPEKGPDPLLNIPQTWTASLDNGMKIYGIEQDELPLVNFEVVIDGGFYLDDPEKIGVANLMTDIMMEGTESKTPEELEEEIELLGANIYMYTSNEEIVIRANTLSRNYLKTLALVEEILLEPRWDKEQFELAKTRTINNLIQREADPNFLAGKWFNRLIYDDDHIFSHYIQGTPESVKSITLEDLKTFYDNYFAPDISSFLIAGDINRVEVVQSLESLGQRWKFKEVSFPEYEKPQPVEHAKLYFYDVPGAKQSVIRIGTISLSRNDPDYYPAVVMNYKLGGSFSGTLNMILREEKGYTYGARSYFSGMKQPAPFIASASVRSGATQESVQIFMDEMEKYRQGISDEDLEFTRNALIKSNARRFETLGSLTNMLWNISKFDLPVDYIKEEENIITNMTAGQHQQLAEKYIRPDKMVYLVVGDAETQLESLKNLGLGDPVLLNN